jgi:signal transduction histidine kinase
LSPHAAPLKLLALFVLLSGIPLGALGWLGWRVLQQDRALEMQRLRGRLEDGASLAARDLDRRLTEWETLLPAGASGQVVSLPQRAVFLLINADGVIEQQGVPLPYYPHVAAAGVDAFPFVEAEHQEFREQNLVAAIAAYRALSTAKDTSVQAGALMRLARVLRKQGRLEDALRVYTALGAHGAVVVAGSPAELVARRERIALLDASGDPNAAAHERTLLATALTDGRFRIDRATFDHFHERVSVRADARPAPPGSALAAAVNAMWVSWQDQASGRTSWTSEEGTFVAIWRRTPSGTAVITAGLEALLPSMQAALGDLQLIAQLDDQSGKPIWGKVDTALRVTKSARETGLPWSLHVGIADNSRVTSIAASRDRLFIAGFALMAIVIVSAGYFVFRAVNRELAVARLQSDFVAAVSHEFRTPLTAMCHLTEMLEQGDTRVERLPDYYRALGKESRRLHTMVENLLDFGRMDSGRRTYDFCDTDPGEIIDRVMQEFADRSVTAARRIERLPTSSQAMLIRADREAITLALRNLVDNAIKYSPDACSVRLGVTAHNGSVAVSVADGGPGVGEQERREIFRKFTRGAAARSLNVKGTGIGLTMANQIVKAHGGRLELESEPGRGSTFTMVLPAVAR